MFVNKHFINTGAYISKSKRFYDAKSLAYFYITTKIPLNFGIPISVPVMVKKELTLFNFFLKLFF